MSDLDKGNRRDSPRRLARHDIRLQASLSLLDAEAIVSATQDKTLTLYGMTSDISDKGMSLVLTSVHIDEQYCRDDDQRLDLMLDLPTGPIKMQVSLVRCVPLDEAEPGKGFFIGARIVDISADERALFIEYLQTIPQAEGKRTDGPSNSSD